MYIQLPILIGRCARIAHPSEVDVVFAVTLPYHETKGWLSRDDWALWFIKNNKENMEWIIIVCRSHRRKEFYSILAVPATVFKWNIYLYRCAYKQGSQVKWRERDMTANECHAVVRYGKLVELTANKCRSDTISFRPGRWIIDDISRS